MERQQLDQDALDFVAQKRAAHRAAADAGEDDEFAKKDRRNREHVLGPYCRVQEDDDVLHNGQVVRVICAARDETWFYGLMVAPFGMVDAPMDGQYITDRAPADAADAPLPIRIDPPPPPPHEPGGPPVMESATAPDVEPEDA